jgi:pyruvate dehydrogenase E1 component beta subunit
MRTLTYAEAINEGLKQAMELESSVLVMGQLVDYKPGIFGTTLGLVEQFGTKRVLDFPIAENGMTATAVGAALGGLRPVICHQRLDFMLYSMDQIVNWLALWYFKGNGTSSLPVTIRAVIGKGWGQGPQHSKSLHAWFSHLPGIRVALPATPYDAKGLLLESIFSEVPTIIIENRALFSMKGHVPEEPYRVRFGNAKIRRAGRDLTLVAIGSLLPMALRCAEQLSNEGIDVEVIDLRTSTPLDQEKILQSVAKTKRIAVADPAWQSVGLAAEIVAMASDHMGGELMATTRICLPDSHTPMSYVLEDEYYVSDEKFMAKIRGMF